MSPTTAQHTVVQPGTAMNAILESGSTGAGAGVEDYAMEKSIDCPPAIVERPENEHWRRWSEDDARRKEHDAMVRRAAVEKPIHPRELAQHIAVEMHEVAPDWRLYRPQLGLYWGQLLRAQPECDPRLTRERESAIGAVFNAVPLHVRPLVAQLRSLLELALIGHECAAFAVAWEAARLFERRQMAAGEPPPESPTPQRRRVQSRNELARILADLRRAADELGCDVEITVRPTARSSPTTPRRRPEADHDALRLHMAE